jgi:hypothetical protein
MMRAKRARTVGTARTVRRSVALARELVEEAQAAAPPELAHNLNRLVATALREYAARRRRRLLEEAVARMAADPAIVAECATIARQFAATEGDGLRR